MKPYGCFNRVRRSTVWVFDGYQDAPRVRVKVRPVPDVMSTECQYSKEVKNDPRCFNCKHKHADK